MQRQEDAWLGKQGGVLWVVSADSGEKLAQQKIDALPVWDGMIAANGCLYLSTTDGEVMCFAGKSPQN